MQPVLRKLGVIGKTLYDDDTEEEACNKDTNQKSPESAFDVLNWGNHAWDGRCEPGLVLKSIYLSLPVTSQE